MALVVDGESTHTNEDDEFKRTVGAYWEVIPSISKFVESLKRVTVAWTLPACVSKVVDKKATILLDVEIGVIVAARPVVIKDDDVVDIGEPSVPLTTCNTLPLGALASGT